MNDTDRFKMVDPEMDVRRLAKKLFPNLWVHHGVISNVPPSGPMSPARVTDMADRMSAAVLVFSHTLRPVLQYYLEKHSSTMECSKISFWTHLAFLCLRIRLRSDHLFDYFLNSTAVVAECALSCGRGRLDEVHAWATTFFCAFFEHEVVGPFYSAGGWAGLMNYIQETDLLGVFERLVPNSLVAVASEQLSAERRERVMGAARSLRGDEIERFEPAKILAAKIFHWDFSEKFPMSPLAPGSFKRTPNIRRRKTRSKSESAQMRWCHVDVEPCVASSAPSLRYIEAARPDVKRVHTLRSISIDVKAKLSSDVRGPYIPLSPMQSDIGARLGDISDETSSVVEATSTSDLQRSYDSTSSLSVWEPVSSPTSSFNNVKSKSPPIMMPKSLFPISMDENQTTENLQALEDIGSGVEDAQNGSRYRRFSLPNSNRRTLIETMQEKNPAVFQTFIWKDDFTLRKSKQTKYQVEDGRKQNKDRNKNCHSLQKKTFSFEDINSIDTEDHVRKNSKEYQFSHWRTSYDSMASVGKTFSLEDVNSIDAEDHVRKNSKEYQCSDWRTSYESMASVGKTSIRSDDVYSIDTEDHVRKNSKVNQCSWRTSYESMASVETDSSSNTNLGNSINSDETDDIGKLVAKLLLTDVTDDPYMKEDNNKIGALSSDKNEQILAKSPERNATTLKSSYRQFEEDTVSVLSNSSSGICNDFKQYKNRRHCHVTSSNDSIQASSISKHSESKSADDPQTSEREGKSLTDKVTELPPSSSSSDCDDRSDKVVIHPDTQTVLYKKRFLMGGLAKRVRKVRGDNRSETPEKGKTDPTLVDFRISDRKEKDNKKISDIQRALKNSGVPNPVVFKI